MKPWTSLSKLTPESTMKSAPKIDAPDLQTNLLKMNALMKRPRMGLQKTSMPSPDGQRKAMWASMRKGANE